MCVVVIFSQKAVSPAEDDLEMSEREDGVDGMYVGIICLFDNKQRLSLETDTHVPPVMIFLVFTTC